MSRPNFESFKEAFGAPIESMYTFCECGEQFGSKENAEDALISTWYGIIEIEGKQYVEECTCWRERARQIADWLDHHKHAIAKYLQIEKKRLTEFAENHPTVEV